MWREAYWLFRVLVACVGGICLYAGLFLKEDAEGRIDNFLVRLWVLIDDQEKLAISKAAELMRGFALLTAKLFDYLLGENLFSVRALLVSCCYSLASIFVFLLTGSSEDWTDGSNPLILTLLLVMFILFLGLAILRPRIHQGGASIAWCICVLVLFLGAFAVFHRLGFFQTYESDSNPFGWVKESPRPSTTVEMVSFAVALLGGISCDIAFIVSSRYLFRRSSQMKTAWPVGGIVFCNISIAFLLVGIPAYLVGDRLNMIWPETESERVAGLVGMSNLLDLLVAALFVVVAAVLILHRALWPIIEKPVYLLQRIGMIGRRKLAIGLGAAMLYFSTGINMERLQKIFELFSG